MKNKMKSILIMVAMVPLIASAADLNVSGSVSANGGHVYASQYLQSIGETYVGTFLNVGTSLTAGTYLWANGEGYFGNYLRIGGNTNTPAAKSVQIGQYATASAFNSLVVGRYNVIEGTASSWVANTANEPLLVAGNGADATHPNNAFAVYKDGTVTMSKAQGDILMGQFGN